MGSKFDRVGLTPKTIRMECCGKNLRQAQHFDRRLGSYNGKNAWLSAASSSPTATKQDAYDADAVNSTLERHVVPLFYKHSRRQVPKVWCRLMAETMRSICAKFSTHQMVAEYVKDLYLHP